MKTIIVVSLAVILLMGVMVVPAYASPGFINPNSRMYFIQPISESIRMFFTFSKQAKMDYLLELADRRTEEMNIAPSSKIVRGYTEHFAQLEKMVEEIPEMNKNQVVEKIKEASLRQQEILAKVYSQVPQQTQEAIINAQENSSKHVENIIEAVGGTQSTKDYKQQVAQIQQIEQAEQIEQASKENGPSDNPGEFTPRELNGINQPRQLNSIDASSTNENGGGSGQMQPAQPIQMNQPNNTN